MQFGDTKTQTIAVARHRNPDQLGGILIKFQLVVRIARLNGFEFGALFFIFDAQATFQRVTEAILNLKGMALQNDTVVITNPFSLIIEAALLPRLAKLISILTLKFDLAGFGIKRFNLELTDRRFRVSIPEGTSSDLELRVGSPDQDDLRPYRFAVLADVQEAIPSVRDIYTRMNQDQDIRFVVFSGDLTLSLIHI